MYKAGNRGALMKIDGVFSGGGIKGFALVGALQILEKKGFSFERIAGTSAGSIVGAFLSAGYTGKEMQQILSKTDISSLLDPRKTLLHLPFTKWLLLYWKLGLYKGDALEKWIASMLAAKGIVTFADVPYQSLRIIVSDITNGQLVILPDDLDKYGMNPLEFSIAKAVRMSCSIPYFFEPVKLYHERKKSLFVDGSVLSNFPIWLFDSENIKKVRPVLGLKLNTVDSGNAQQEIDNAIELFGALFKTMKDAHDSRYITKKHVKNIMFIPMKGISATDFLLTEKHKEELFDHGRIYAADFLKTWTY
jgi:NTE family protein